MHQYPVLYKREMLRISNLIMQNVWQTDTAILPILCGTVLTSASSKTDHC